MWEYDYVNSALKTNNQYLDAGLDLTRHSVVDALYIHSFVPGEVGNPLIEALPLPLEKESLRSAYTTGIKGYNTQDISKLSKMQRILSLRQLRDVRMQLPFHYNLENQMAIALRTAYSDRYIVFNSSPNVGVHVGDSDQLTCYRGDADSESATSSGFALLGYSGCGKSSSIRVLTDHYPQVIRHHPGPGKTVTQIVYLVVNCLPNSNFTGLYKGIGRAIDQALGVTDHYHENLIAKTLTLEKKQQKIREFIENYFIGIILFDEIQLINFSSNKENTYKSLLTLSNMTKVALGVIGTDDAYNKMFPELYTGRRVGVTITGNTYCENEKFCQVLLKQLFKYQWTEHRVALTPEIADTFYSLTKGIIDQIVSLYFYLQYECISSDYKGVVDEKFIKKVSNKYFPGLQELLTGLDDPTKEAERAEIMRRVTQNLDQILEQAEQNAQMEAMISESVAENNELHQEIIGNVLLFCGDEYSEAQIKAAISKVEEDHELSIDTIRDFQKKVVAILKAKKPRKRASKQKKDKVDIADLKKFIEDQI